MELITRKWTDIDRKVKSAGLWGLVTLVVGMLLRNAGIDADAGVVTQTIRDVITAAGPLIPVIAGYMSRGSAPK